MKVFNIGELIRQRREECGFSQEELCYGICEQPTLSRIESGATTPSRSKLTALLQRLGMSGEKYYALLSENELEVANLQNEITSCIVRRDYSKGLSKLAKLEQIIESDDHILKQYILAFRVALGKEIDGQILRYDVSECIEMLFDAIRMTVPQFSIEKLDKFILGTDEIQIINQIAKTYADYGKLFDSIIIYSKLMNYVETHMRTLNQDSIHSPVSILIAYNYSRVLYFNSQYFEAITIAEKGLDYSRNLRNLSYLGSLLFIKAHSLFHLNDFKECKNFLLQSYYVYKVTNDTESSNYVRKIIKQLLHETLED